MSSATAILRQEHDAILQMLEVSEELARLLEQGERVAAETLADLLEFFRVFADQCHHGKEENLLFPLLLMKGLPPQSGPIQVMLSEHEQGRAFGRQMAEAADAYGRGDLAAGSRWAANARAYAALLRQHIDKENHVLFLMADNLLTDAEQRALAEAFEKLEDEKIGVGTHQRLHALMQKLTTEVLAH